MNRTLIALCGAVVALVAWQTLQAEPPPQTSNPAGAKDEEKVVDSNLIQQIAVWDPSNPGHIKDQYYIISYRDSTKSCFFLSSVTVNAFTREDTSYTCGDSPSVVVYYKVHYKTSDVRNMTVRTVLGPTTKPSPATKALGK